MKTFELTQEQIDQLAEKKHAKKLLKEFIPEAFKTKLEVGRWYKKIWKDGDIDLFLIDEINGDYIIFNKTYFRNNENITCVHNRYSIDGILNDKRLKLVLATEEEVSEALINETKKRGFNNIGDLKIKNTYGCISNGFVTITNDFYYDYISNTLQLDGAIIFNNGKWAEIIEQSDPTKEEINRVLTFLKNQNEQ